MKRRKEERIKKNYKQGLGQNFARAKSEDSVSLPEIRRKNTIDDVLNKSFTV